MAKDRRAEILAAARELTAASGIAAVTVRSVAARAGIGASTLRYYFPTQRELHVALAAAAFDDQLDDLRIADTRLDPAARLTECLAQFLPDRDDRIPQLEAWIALYHPFGEATDQRRALLGGLSRRALERVDGWLAILESEGVLRPGTRRRHVATAFVAVDGVSLGLLSGVAISTVEEGVEVLRAVIEHVIVASSQS